MYSRYVMIIGYIVFAILALVVGFAFLKRGGGSSTGEKDLGFVSSSWLSEHRSGHQ